MHVMKFSVNGECTERIRLRMGDSIHVNLEWESRDRLSRVHRADVRRTSRHPTRL